MYDSVALITNCQFSFIKAFGPGAILHLSINFAPNITGNALVDNADTRNPTFKVARNSFEHISSDSGTFLHWISASRGIFLKTEDNHFAAIICHGNGGLIFAQYPLQPHRLPTLRSESYFRVISRNDIAIGISGTRNGGVIYAEGGTELFNLTLINLTLSDIVCKGDGGVAYLFSPNQNAIMFNPLIRQLDTLQETSVGTLRISQSTLRNIIVENGGIIYERTPSDTLFLDFVSNILENISAYSRGGAFYIVKPITSIYNNVFDRVFANLAGPIIYSVSDQLNLTNFIAENIITSSLSTVASVAPTNLLVEFTSLSDGSPIALEYEDTPPYNPIVPNLTSYSLSEYQITMTLVSNGPQGLQPVYDESNSPYLVLVFISRDGENRTILSTNCSHSVCKDVTSTVTLRGLAGELILVNATYHSRLYTQFQQFSIRLRSCLPGEINNTKDHECVYCRPGTYSLTPTDTKCSECPGGAICKGGSNIIIQPGYYKSKVSSTSARMINCNDSGSRCKGNNTCADPFTGPLCLQCNREKGYFMDESTETCVLCSKKSALIAVASFLLVASIVYQIVMLIITYRENKSIHAQSQEQGRVNTIRPGQFLVILATYVQIISVVANIDESTISSLLKVTSTDGNPNTQVVFSLQCLYRLYFSDSFKALQVRVLAYVLSPVIKILVVVIFEFFRNLIYRDPDGLGRKKSLQRVGLAAVILILLEQPGIVGVLCKYLTCSQLDPLVNAMYIKTHNSIQCDTDKYNFFKKVVVVPALTVWAFLIPLGIILILYRIKKRLHFSESLRIVYGSLYNSYHENSYYWGVVIILLKVIIYVINSTINASPIFKGVPFMWLIQVYLYFLKKRVPYSCKYLYTAENLCCGAYLIILTLAFIRLSTDHHGIKYACSVMIVITVSVAGGYVLLKLGGLVFLRIRRIIQQIQDKIHSSEGLHRRDALLIDLPER